MLFLKVLFHEFLCEYLGPGPRDKNKTQNDDWEPHESGTQKNVSILIGKGQIHCHLSVKIIMFFDIQF